MSHSHSHATLLHACSPFFGAGCAEPLVHLGGYLDLHRRPWHWIEVYVCRSCDLVLEVRDIRPPDPDPAASQEVFWLCAIYRCSTAFKPRRQPR